MYLCKLTVLLACVVFTVKGDLASLLARQLRDTNERGSYSRGSSSGGSSGGGYSGGESCSRYLDRTCPATGYTKLKALERAAERGGPTAMQSLLRSVPLREYCSEITSALNCFTAAVRNAPQSCKRGPESEALDMMVKGSALVQDVCRNDVQTLQSNVVCLTDQRRLDDVQSCAQLQAHKFSGNTPPTHAQICQAYTEVATCVAQKVGVACSKSAEKVLQKIIKEVVGITKPVCQSDRRGPGYFMDMMMDF